MLRLRRGTARVTLTALLAAVLLLMAAFTFTPALQTANAADTLAAATVSGGGGGGGGGGTVLSTPDGTSGNPFIITTAAELAGLASEVNAGNTVSGQVYYYRLGNDIDLSGYSSGQGWIPIGTGDNPFQGNFDGANHIISGLSINTTDDYAGLFGYINGSTAVVQNLKVSVTDVVGGYSVGGVAGCVDGGSVIENCSTTGAISGTNNVGGVVGWVNNDCSLTGCYSSCAVSGVEIVGGVAGEVYFGNVTNCYATGPVNSTGVDLGPDVGFPGSYAGGVIGEVTGGNVTGCYASGPVTGAGVSVGGVTGDVSGGSVTNCYSTGTVNGAGYYVGGVVGYVDGTSAIEACHATGAVSGVEVVGGVAGEVAGGNVSGCYATGPINSTGFSNPNNPDFGYVSAVGGVAGEVAGGNVTGCYASGSVTGAGNFVGGVGGDVVGGSVANCYSTGTVNGAGYLVGGVVGLVTISDGSDGLPPSGGNLTNCYATGAVSGGDGVGGVVGGVGSTGSYISAVQNCAALNQVVTWLGVPDSTDPPSIGRVAGYNDGGTLSNNVAFSGMTSVGADLSTAATDNAANGINGANITAVAINGNGTIGGLFASAPWATANGQLPGLGAPVNMPAYLQPTGPATVTAVTVSPNNNVSVQKNASQRFTSSVTGTNSPAQTVDWSVSGNNSSDTIITSGGILTVAANETATTLTVTATSTVDRTKSAAVTVTITAASPGTGGGGGGGGTAKYVVKFETNGGSTISSQSVANGSKVTKPADPTKDGYTFAGWYSDQALTTAYDFTKGITGGTTIYAKWTAGAATPPVPTPTPTPTPTTTPTPGQPSTGWQNHFSDVKSTDWFYGDVEYAIVNGIFNGTGAATFSPNGSVTRGMFVTVLWRAAGSPAASGGNTFTDVQQDAYYAEAVQWAAANNIVKGISSSQFAPNGLVTREQMAAILYRYQQFTGQVVPGAGTTKEFADQSKISDYAKDPVNTLVKHGILGGKSNNLFEPQGTATRAEVASMLHRYLTAASSGVTAK